MRLRELFAWVARHQVPLDGAFSNEPRLLPPTESTDAPAPHDEEAESHHHAAYFPRRGGNFR